MFTSAPEISGYSNAELEAILRWYADMGVDVVVDPVPRDRFADCAPEIARRAALRASPEAEAAPARERPKLPASAPLANAPRAGAAPSALAPDFAIEMAAQLAASCETLEALRLVMETFEGCALQRTASKLVFGDGNPAAKIMFVGEAPGTDEDRHGTPFVGAAGQLLDRMLAAIGLDRASAYLANAVPWRPPGNRPTTPVELAICLPFIHRQIALVDPDIVVCLGAFSTQALLGWRESILRVRGKWGAISLTSAKEARAIRALATLSPNYLLDAPRAKRDAWRDLRILRKAMDAT